MMFIPSPDTFLSNHKQAYLLCCVHDDHKLGGPGFKNPDFQEKKANLTKHSQQ